MRRIEQPSIWIYSHQERADAWCIWRVFYIPNDLRRSIRIFKQTTPNRTLGILLSEITPSIFLGDGKRHIAIKPTQTHRSGVEQKSIRDPVKCDSINCRVKAICRKCVVVRILIVPYLREYPKRSLLHSRSGASAAHPQMILPRNPR